MSKCEISAQCNFFDTQMANRPSTTKIYRELFCELNPGKCARYIVVKEMGPELVPFDLYPNQKDRAYEICRQCNLSVAPPLHGEVINN